MAEHPLNIFEQNDPEFFKLVTDTRTFAMTDGALSKKVKLLIAMALDAAHGTESGVRSLALQAKEAGATKQEILEDDQGGPLHLRRRFCLYSSPRVKGLTLI